jgi:hypothetical protein
MHTQSLDTHALPMPRQSTGETQPPSPLYQRAGRTQSDNNPYQEAYDAGFRDGYARAGGSVPPGSEDSVSGSEGSWPAAIKDSRGWWSRRSYGEILGTVAFAILVLWIIGIITEPLR